jgi:hypothetical protein
MYIPDPDLDFLPIPDTGVKRLRIPDRQHCSSVPSFATYRLYLFFLLTSGDVEPGPVSALAQVGGELGGRL